MFTQTLMDGIDGIVLDAVGTLIRADPSVSEAYLAVASRQGVSLSLEVVRARFHAEFRDDETRERAGGMRTSEDNERARWRRIVARVLPELPEPDRGFAELWEHFARAESWRCFEDVAPAIGALTRAGIPFRIASNFDGRLRAVVGGLVDLAGCERWLQISSEVGLRKPHPEFYQSVCADLGLPPERVLWVGDDPENDGEGPRRAGLRSVLLDRSQATPERAFLVSDLGFLARWGG